MHKTLCFNYLFVLKRKVKSYYFTQKRKEKLFFKIDINQKDIQQGYY